MPHGEMSTSVTMMMLIADAGVDGMMMLTTTTTHSCSSTHPLPGGVGEEHLDVAPGAELGRHADATQVATLVRQRRLEVPVACPSSPVR
jgi:hypothetical protein